MAVSIDDVPIVLAVADLVTRSRRPLPVDRLELAVYGLSGDWLSRRLLLEFRKYGCFPIVERLLARWVSAERRQDRARLEGVVDLLVGRGVLTTDPEGRLLGAPGAQSGLESLVSEALTFAAPS